MKYHALQRSILLAAVMAFGLGIGMQGLAAPRLAWSAARTPAVDDGNANGRLLRGRATSRAGGTQTTRLLAIPVQFRADIDPLTTGTGVMPYRTWGPASQPGYLQKRLAEVSRYYDEVSAHRLNLVCELAGTVTAPDVMANYAADLLVTQTDETKRARLMRDIVTLCDSRVNFSNYDIITLIHAGTAREASLDPNSLDLPSLFYVMNGIPAIQTDDGVAIDRWCLVPETLCDDTMLVKANPTLTIATYEANPPATLPDETIATPHYWDVTGVWAHEIGHALGMANVYDTAYAGGLSLGKWSVMADGAYLPVPDVETEPDPWLIPYDAARPYFGSCPSHPDAWNKVNAGWPLVKTVKGRLLSERIAPQSAPSPVVYRLAKGGDEIGKEYFLAECRAQIGFDRYVPQSGLVVYHVDDTIGSLDADNLQWDRYHPRVFLESSDATPVRDQVSPTAYQYVPGDDSVFPGGLNKTSFGPLTMPSSDSYVAGATGIQIDNISLQGAEIVADLSVAVQVVLTFVDPAPNSTAYVSMPMMRATVLYLDPATVQVRVNGALMPAAVVFYDPAGGSLMAQLGPLTEGRYQVTVSALTVFGGAPVSGVLSFTMENKRLPAGMQMITVPGMGVGNAFSVFAGSACFKLAWFDPLNGSAGSYAYFESSTANRNPLADFTSVRGAAVELPASPADVRRDVPPAGKGFWLDLAAAATARLGGGQPSNARRYLVPLTKNGFEPGGGFNMIGNPYTYPVPFGGLFVEYNGHEMTIQQAVAEGIIDPVLYTWDAAARGYVAVRLEGGVMQPWVGYWLHCNRGMVLPAGSVLTPDQNILGPVRIIFQPIAGTRAATTAVAQRRAGTADAWEFPVRARGVAGMADVVLGVAAGATGGVDPVLDLWAPPAAPGGVRLTSRVGRGSLYADYRSPVAAGGSVVWDLEVSGEPGDVVTVSWPDLTQIPAGCGLVVRDGVTGEERFMRTVAGFTVVLGPGERSRRLTVTAAPAGAALALSQLSARREAAGTARITCKTSMPATVTGEIRTAAGVLVARVTAAAAGAGNVVLLWDGRDQHGARVPRGVYQCQVVGVAADGQTAKAATVLAL